MFQEKSTCPPPRVDDNAFISDKVIGDSLDISAGCSSHRNIIISQVVTAHICPSCSTEI